MFAHGPVPVLGGHELTVFFLQVAILLTLAVLLGRLATRLRLPAVVGELLAGVLLGPSLLGQAAPQLSAALFPAQAEQFHLLDAVGQVGVVLLVGSTGMQLDFGFVRRRWVTAAHVSIPSLVLPLALGIAAGFAMPAALLPHGSDRAVVVLFIGVAMSVSAIPVIAKTLHDMGLLHRDIGQLTLAAGTMDDTVGWLLLAVVSAMATTGLRGPTIGRQVWLLAMFLVAMALIGCPVARRIMRHAARAEGNGLATACAVLIILLGAAATVAMGLEGVFGALVAGIVLGTCGQAIQAALGSLRQFALSVLAPVFFATAGLRVDLTTLGRPVVLMFALLMLALAVIGKFVGAFIGAMASRLTRWEALALGAGMNARGVIQLVVATVGLQLGVLTAATYTVIVLIAIITSVMAPPILKIAATRIELTSEEQLRQATYQLQAASAPAEAS